ncbi:MAG TPA: RNA polymerase sigma factor [Anaerolineae bacterium]|nr:RNA polymerase sigma factor [Anaerolineae bacterium]
MSDTVALIQDWQAGNEEAAEALYNAHRSDVYRLAYALLGNAEDAEEVAQDALTYALVNIRHYAPERASFATWLHTITVSRCRDRQRRKRLVSFSLTEWLGLGRDLSDPAPGPEASAIEAERREALLQAMQELHPAVREALVLRYWAGHTFREIAEIMDCPLPTAQSRVRLGYQQLRVALREERA